jgi:hypothetical protein
MATINYTSALLKLTNLIEELTPFDAQEVIIYIKGEGLLVAFLEDIDAQTPIESIDADLQMVLQDFTEGGE